MSAIKQAFHTHLHRLAAAFSLVLFVLALIVLHRELADIHIADVRQALSQVSFTALLLSAVFTVGSYIALTGYDVLALRHLGKRLPYPRVAQTSFIATAIGHNLGMAMLSAGMIRLRYYTAAGLSATEVTGMAALIGLSFGIGITFVSSLAMLLEPGEAGLLLHLNEANTRILGAMLMIVVVSYLGLNALRRRPILVRNWQLTLPGAKITTGQLVLASVDLICAAAALFWLLPADASVSFPVFLGIYVQAIVAGIASHVPAGLGVFETVLVLTLPGIPKDQLLAAILAYRAIYYIFPLILAALLGAWKQVREQSERLAQGLDAARGIFAWMAPMTVSVSVFFTGVILLLSGSTPALSERIHLLRDFVPLPLLEASHLIGSLAGFALVILARALYRRVDAAYHLAFWLLTAGMLASLVKGLDYEEALLSAAVLGILWLGRGAFNRPSSVIAQSFSPGWMATIFIVLLATIWLGLFSYKHVDYSNELWWHFAFRADAPRFLRASLLLALMVVGLGLMRLLQPTPPEPNRPTREDLACAGAIVATSTDTDSALALLGDKRLLFSPDADAFIMFQVRGNSWVAMGDPVGPTAACEALAWRFRELVDRHGGRAVFYQVGAHNLPLYLDMGLGIMKLGEEAVVPLKGFNLEGSARKDLRQTHSKGERDGLAFEMIPPEAVPALIDELRGVSDNWLAEKNTREKGFSLGNFQPEYLARFPCALIRKEGRIVAFANVWASSEKHELSIDLMRHTSEAPRSVMDYLFIELMLWGTGEGYAQFNLGMAPLSGLESHPLAPLWHRLGTLIYRQGEHFYNFEGLRAYKNKFDPIWQPKYLVSMGGIALPTTLLDVAALIAGGIKGVFSR